MVASIHTPAPPPPHPHETRNRRLELGIYIVIFIALAIYMRGTRHIIRDVDHRQTVVNCIAIEKLKHSQYEAASNTIKGDLTFLKAHPGGTVDFPEPVVRADIADKRKTLALTKPTPCPSL